MAEWNVGFLVLMVELSEVWDFVCNSFVRGFRFFVCCGSVAWERDGCGVWSVLLWKLNIYSFCTAKLSGTSKASPMCRVFYWTPSFTEHVEDFRTPCWWSCPNPGWYRVGVMASLLLPLVCCSHQPLLHQAILPQQQWHSCRLWSGYPKWFLLSGRSCLAAIFHATSFHFLLGVPSTMSEVEFAKQHHRNLALE